MTFCKDPTLQKVHRRHFLLPQTRLYSDIAFPWCFFSISISFLNISPKNPLHFEIPSSKYESLSCTETDFLRTIQRLESFSCAGAWKEGIIFHSNSFFHGSDGGYILLLDFLSLLKSLNVLCNILCDACLEAASLVLYFASWHNGRDLALK